MGLPHFLFLNKIDTFVDVRVRDILAQLQPASSKPLVLRQMPIQDGGGITGYVDLMSERAYRYRKGQESELIQIPERKP